MKNKPNGAEEVSFPESSNIHSAFYVKEAKAMVIRFKQSKDDDMAKSAYEYEGVNEELWEQLKNSQSKGEFVRKAIVAKFKGTKIWAA